jgi:hypothetical protein
MKRRLRKILDGGAHPNHAARAQCLRPVFWFLPFWDTRLRVEAPRLFFAVLVKGHTYEHSVAHRKNGLRLIVFCCDLYRCAVRLELNGLGACANGRTLRNFREAISQCRVHKRGRTSIAEEREP